MAFKDGATKSKSAIYSFVRDLITVRNFVMVAAGILAGYSIAVLGKDAVVVPFLGSVPGVLVSVVGLTVAFAVYRRASCCDDCNDNVCGCTCECGDSCSYDP